MSTVSVPETKEVAIRRAFEVTKEQIEEAVSLAMQATVDGPEDKEGMKLAHEYRMGLRTMRTTVDKTRKQLKADVLERGRLIDRVAKELSEPIPDAEARLQELEDTAKREEERLAAIEKEEREKAIHRRTELADEVHLRIPLAMLSLLTDDEFTAAYQEKKAANEAEEEAKRQEQERLELERKKQEAIAAEQKAKQDELDRKEAEQAARQKAIEDAERARREKCLGWRTTQLAAINCSMDANAIMAFSDDDFELYVKERRVEFEKQQAEKVEAERRRKEQEAKELETRIAAEAKEQAAKLEAERLAKIEREKAKAEKARLAAERKAARAPDIDKLKLYTNAVAAVPVPHFKDDDLLRAVQVALGEFTTRLACLAIEEA